MSSDQATAPKIYLPPAELAAAAAVSGMAGYQALCAEAEADYEGYWARLAREFISWKTPFTKVLDSSTAPMFKWFEDGTLNASYNCLDRHVEAGRGDKTALIFEADGGEVTKVTYRELLARTCQMANGLKSLGVQKGDRVVFDPSNSYIENIATGKMTAIKESGGKYHLDVEYIVPGFTGQAWAEAVVRLRP